MSFTQDLFSSRRNYADGNVRIGELDRLWYDSITNTLRIGDGITQGGKPITSSLSNANIGNLVIYDTTISTLNPLEPITIQADNGGNINLVGVTQIRGNSSFYNLAEFYGGILLASDLDAQANLRVQGTLIVDGTTHAIGNFTANGTSALIGNVIMSGTTYVADTFTANGLSHLIGNVIMSGTTQTIGNSAVNGTFTANGLSHLIGNVVMSGTSQTIGTFLANGNVIMSGTSALIGNVTITGNSDVLGTSIVQGKFTANGISSLVGNVLMSGNVLTIGDDRVDGKFTANGTTTLVGNTSVFGYMDHTGDTLFVGNVQHTGNLHVDGTTRFDGNTSVIGYMEHTGDTLFVGNVQHTGNLNIDGYVDISRDTNIVGNLSVTGESTFVGNGTDYGSRTQNGSVTINGQLYVSGTGNVKFNDGTTQTTASTAFIQNAGHITGAYVYTSTQRGLSLTSDATPIDVPSTIVSRDGNGNIAVGNITAATINTTVVGGNNSIAGSMIVYGNLQVLGTTTTVQANTIQLDSKLIIVSNSAVTSSQADASGLQVGNATVFADFLFDNGQQAWRSDVSIVPKIANTGNIGSDTRYWNWAHFDYAHVSQQLLVGLSPDVDYGTVAQFTANTDSYSQIIHQNLSSNSSASTDFVAQSDNGDLNTNYIDMGINSSTYNDPAYTISSANDGYLYTNGGDLTLGTQTVGKDVVFHTDGTLAANEAGRIHLGRWILGGAVDDGVTRMQIGDGLRVVSTVTAGNISTTGNVIAGNVYAQNITDIATSVTTANTNMKGYVDSQDTIISNSVVGANSAMSTANTIQSNQINALGNSIIGANTAIGTANTAMQGYVDAANTIQSNQINTLSNSITGANAAIVTANTAMKGYVDAGNTIQSNQINTLSNSITGANAAIVTANTAMKGYVDAGNTIQSNQITTLQGQVYSNVNVAAYLPTYSGNLTAGNITATTKFYGNVNGTATQLATAATAIGTFLAGKLSAATGSIPKNSIATVTYTITGLTTNHKIIITPGTVMPDRLFSVSAAWASATNTVSIEYANNTGGAISVTLDINYFAFV